MAICCSDGPTCFAKVSSSASTFFTEFLLKFAEGHIHHRSKFPIERMAWAHVYTGRIFGDKFQRRICVSIILSVPIFFFRFLSEIPIKFTSNVFPFFLSKSKGDIPSVLC
jgi:hypothetical protein